MTDDTRVHQDIADLRGDIRELRAELVGRMETLTATKVGDHARIDQSLANLTDRQLTTDRTVAALTEDVAEVQGEIERAKGWAAGVSVAAGLCSGLVVFLLSMLVG